MEYVGRIREINLYPVKSMAGVSTSVGTLGWHGLAGDRRLAFRRVGDEGNFPWLTASTLPELLRYQPCDLVEQAGEALPTHVLTPEGRRLELRGAALRDEISEKLGRGVEMLWFRNGIFDEGAVSVIDLATIRAIGREAGLELDPRRFRANIVLEGEGAAPFHEDGWVGEGLVFGEGESGPALSITQRDLRCRMVNLDPDTAGHDARVMKAVARLNQSCAGVYAAALRPGELRVGDRVSLARGAPLPLRA